MSVGTKGRVQADHAGKDKKKNADKNATQPSADALADPLAAGTLSDGLVPVDASSMVASTTDKPKGTPYSSAFGVRPAGSKEDDAKKGNWEKAVFDDKFEHKTANGNKFTLGTGKGGFADANGNSTTLSDKGLSQSTTTGKNTQTTSFGKDGFGYGNTNKVTAADGKEYTKGNSFKLGPDGGAFTRENGNGGKTSFSLGNKTGLSYKNKKGNSIGASYDAEKGQVGLSGSVGGLNANMSVGDNHFGIGMGNKNFGGNLSMTMDEHTTDIGGGLYVKGIGASGGYHSVTDKGGTVDHAQHGLLGGEATETTNTNESGYNWGVGVKIVNGGGWSNDTETTSFSTLNDPTMSKADKEAQTARLDKQSKKGKNGMQLDALQNGEAVSFNSQDAGGWDAGVNALGIARYGYNRSTTDIEGGSVGKRADGTTVGSHTTGEAVNSGHDYGVLWGAYSGKTEFSSLNTGSLQFKSDGSAKNDALLEKYAKHGHGSANTMGLRAGDEVVPGLTTDRVTNVQQDGYKNDQNLLWGLGNYNRETSDLRVTDEQLIADGHGAAKTVTDMSSDKMGGGVAGQKISSTDTKESSSTSAFVSAPTGDAVADKKNFEALRKQADAGRDKVQVDKMKSSDQLSYAKQNKTGNKVEMGGPFGSSANEFSHSKSNSQSTDITKTDQGAVVVNQKAGSNDVKAKTDVLWGLSSSEGGSSVKATQSVVVVGADGTKKVQEVARSGKTDFKAGDKLSDGTVVAETNTSVSATSSSSESSYWGLGDTKGEASSKSKSSQGKVVAGGTQHTVKVGSGSAKQTGSIVGANATAGKVTSGPSGTSIGVAHTQTLSAGGAKTGVSISIAIKPDDMKAITTKYNTGDDAKAFWTKISKEAGISYSKSNPKLAGVFYGVRSPEAFQKLSAGRQQLFIDGVLKDIDDSNPYLAMAAIELMEAPDAKAEAHAKMLERIHKADKEGDGSRVVEEYVKFVGAQKASDPALSKKLAGGVKVTDPTKKPAAAARGGGAVKKSVGTATAVKKSSTAGKTVSKASGGVARAGSAAGGLGGRR